MLTCLTISVIMSTCFLCMPRVSVSCLQLHTVCSQSIYMYHRTGFSEIIPFSGFEGNCVLMRNVYA